ncbi:MAG: T9SS sorting signal type C domain-containing protein [Flavobacteriales bacterium]|nr:MAG: T9SS sorting signal type C domain-containing protein [Flavobacteriales bacterium]
MYPKIQSLIRSLFFKNLAILFFLISFNAFSQTTITRIHTDWKGYWTSNATTGVGNRPNTENNLLAFSWNGQTYSTGVSDNTLTTNGVVFNPQKFRALKIQTLGLDSSTYLLQGSMIDGSASTATLVPPLAGSSATGAELASRLTDGTNGLTLGTGIANIKAGTAEFKVGTNNLNITGIGDGVPDLIVTQVAEPGGSGSADKFKFIDASGHTVGNEISIAFGSVTAIGTYSLDLFKADGGSNGFSPASTRDIRMIGIETSSFGITSANAGQVDRFVITFSGTSDCAFIAFNTSSLKIAELGLVKKASMPSCGKLGDVINYTFEVTNTGEVPITNIQVTDPMPGLVITGNPISSLAVGAKATLTGTYTIKAADVTAGRVTNSAKVTGLDPSLNAVEDISGQTNTDNIPTVIDLLSVPTIGTITNVSCTALGSIVLNNLPATGTWTIERSPGLVTTTGTGTTTTITGLSAGTYTFRVTNSTGCKSPASANATITNQSSTTWNGTAWSNGNPDATKSAVFAGAYTFSADLEACSCTINSGVNLVIPSGRTLKITNALNVTTGGSLTFEDSSSLVQVNDASVNTGNITYKRISKQIRQADFVYWSTPVKPQTLYNVSPTTQYNMYMGFTGDNWLVTNSSNNMIVGKGYIIRGPQGYSNTARADYQASFIGVPNNGVLTGETLSASKFYLIGNPYPSALDAGKFLAGNLFLNGTLYFWTHNTPVVLGGAYQYNADDYASFNLTGGVGTSASTGSGPGNNNTVPSGYIAAGQAFFASAASAGTVTFNNGMRDGGTRNGQFFKPAKTAKETTTEKHRIWLNFTNEGGAFKQVLIGYVDGATNGVDNNYDGETFDGNIYVDFYSMNNQSKFVIQGRALPFADTDIVPLGYRSTVAGDFTIAIDQTDGDLASHSVYIEDKSTGIIQDLKAGKFTFTTAAGTFTDRLVLRYTNKTLGTDDFENAENDILVSVKNKVIKINSSKENIKEVNVYDVSGKLLYNKKKVGATELQIANLQAAKQILLVKVTLDNDYITTKKVIF